MKNKGFSSESGKSIMELLIVLAVAAILVTMAVAQFGGASNNLERQNIAREFKVSLERARFDSVRRRADVCDDMARVVIRTATSFEVVMDMNQNGTIEPSIETRTIDFTNSSNVEIVGSSLAFPITIRFDQRGNSSSGTCASPTAAVAETVFCNLPCVAATANAQNSNIVFVSPTGTAAMMRGGDSVPTFAEPAVTDVDGEKLINPLVAVWDPDPSPLPSASPSPSVIPTVDPSPLPTIDPSPLPTVDPSPSPSVDPSPVGTPTPFACAYGERPDSSGCTCTEPMWVRSNGKCQ
jgi:Tfp pilus assembly protein FimT